MWEHHAYLLVGGRKRWLEQLRPHGPADRVYQEVETYGIDEARQLRRWQEQTIIAETKEGGGGGSRRFLIVSFRHITPEAQNALLKTLEEPARGNHFFLITESAYGLLPTLLSRLQVLSSASGSRDGELELEQWADKFLQSNYEARLALVTDFLAIAEAGPSSRGAKTAALRLVNVLEVKLEGQLRRCPDDQKLVAALTTLITQRDYLHDQAALPKLILEHLALILPQ